MTIAHVICCNDAVMGVHLGSEDAATARMEEMARAEFEIQHWFFEDGFRPLPGWYSTPYELYRHRCYWRIHSLVASE